MPTLDELAAAVRRCPASETAREYLLEALSADPEHDTDPRRLETIEWFLEHSPRHHICTTPFMRLDPGAAPEVFRRLKSRWLGLLADAPEDPALARGAAAFIAAEDLHAARQLLRAALEHRPDEARLWLDLGRMSHEPRERLAAFERAYAANPTLPNLLVWIAKTSFHAGDHERAAGAAAALMTSVHEARERFGDALDWPERGAAFWARARAASPDDNTAGALADAHAEHAFRTHWAHTVMGLLACRENDLERAGVHLRASADVRADYRIAAYGPSFDLLREVCTRGRWDEGLTYLRTWEDTCDHPRLRDWIAAVTEHRVLESGETS